MRNTPLLLIILLPFLAAGQDDIPKTRWYRTNIAHEVAVHYEGYKDDSLMRHGEFKLLYRGNIQVRGFYYKNTKQGQWEKRYLDGSKAIESGFLHGKNHGPWKFWSTEGNLLAEMEFAANKKTGTWRSYYPQGGKCSVVKYNNDRIEGPFKVYHDNGLLAQNTYINYFEGDMYVSSLRFYETGKLYEEAYYLNNQLDSIYRRFHSNSLPWEEFLFDEGRLIKVISLKSPEGVDLHRGDFDEGSGELHHYNAIGKIHSKVNYRQGKREGPARFFSGHKLAQEGSFDGDKRVGIWRYYSKFGKLVTERDFKDGDGQVHEYHFLSSPNSREAREGDLIDGWREGLWKDYNFYGETVQEANYRLGFLHGHFKRWEAQALREEGDYQFGEKVGIWRYYNRRGKVTYEEFHPKRVKFNPELVEDQELAPTPEIMTKFDYETPFIEASFPGGVQQEFAFVQANQRLPKAARRENIVGEVILHFTVTEMGEITDIRVLRGIGYGCDKEAVRVLKSMPWWNPARQNHTPIPTSVTRSFYF